MCIQENDSKVEAFKICLCHMDKSIETVSDWPMYIHLCKYNVYLPTFVQIYCVKYLDPPILHLNFVWNVHRHNMFCFWERVRYFIRSERPSNTWYVCENAAKFNHFLVLFIYFYASFLIFIYLISFFFIWAEDYWSRIMTKKDKYWTWNKGYKILQPR